jgi:hypothetical protein
MSWRVISDDDDKRRYDSAEQLPDVFNGVVDYLRRVETKCEALPGCPHVSVGGNGRIEAKASCTGFGLIDPSPPIAQ